MAEIKPVVLECPRCRVNREFRYSGCFTVSLRTDKGLEAKGQEAHVRSCTECGFKKHFTPNGIPFIKVSKASPIKVSKVSPEITSKTGLDDFLNQTFDLSTYEKGLKFELFCLRLLESMGYEVTHSGQSGDRGVDLKAVRQQPIGSQTLVVQCKHQESVSAEVVIQILGMVSAANANQGLVITTGSFTADAKKFAEENSAIEIIYGNKLADLVKQYLEG